MEEQFWQDRWKSNQIGFHKPTPNPLLTRNFPALQLPVGARVFVPLCGKSLDVHWLLAQGCRVVGAELSQLAVEQLFGDLGLAPSITAHGSLQRYEAETLTVFQGSLFDLTREMLGAVDAVYDRAALVALPEPMRAQYVPHVLALTADAPQMLICFDYDQSCTDGPPFSVDADEVHRRYATTYSVTLLERVSGELLKGRCPADETVWLLQASVSTTR